MEIQCLSDEMISREEIGLYFLNENLWELFTSGNPIPTVSDSIFAQTWVMRSPMVDLLYRVDGIIGEYNAMY